MKMKKKPNPNKAVFHAIALLLMVVGMGAGYFWMPVVGLVMEFVIWIYGGLFIDKEKTVGKKEQG
jgi:hypothetical protein